MVKALIGVLLAAILFTSGMIYGMAIERAWSQEALKQYAANAYLEGYTDGIKGHFKAYGTRKEK